MMADLNWTPPSPPHHADWIADTPHSAWTLRTHRRRMSPDLNVPHERCGANAYVPKATSKFLEADLRSSLQVLKRLYDVGFYYEVVCTVFCPDSWVPSMDETSRHLHLPAILCTRQKKQRWGPVSAGYWRDG